MPIDLVFHVGLTKTASSFLQRKIFKGKMNTLERAIPWEDDEKEAKHFQEVFRCSSPTVWESDYGKKLLPQQLNLTAKANIPVLVSHESLYYQRLFEDQLSEALLAEPFLLASHLSAINNHAWEHGAVKVMFFFRKQSHWLASYYAHTCYRMNRPSQADFEAKVRRMVMEPHRYGAQTCQYDRLIDALSSALGAENVLALPYEGFHLPKTWGAMREFLGRSTLGADIDLEKRSVNVKGIGDNTWSLSQKVFAAPERLLRRVIGLSPKTVTLTSEMSGLIDSYYAESNARLNGMLDFDLHTLGYL